MSVTRDDDSGLIQPPDVEYLSETFHLPRSSVSTIAPALLVTPPSDRLAPMVMVNIRTRGINMEEVTRAARRWANGMSVGEGGTEEWFKMNGLMNDLTEDPPFEAVPIAGRQHWVAIEPIPPSGVHFYFGHTAGRNGVGDFRALLSAMQEEVPHLRQKAKPKWKFWRSPSISTELLIDRTETGIQLKPPPSFWETAFSAETLSAIPVLLLAFFVGTARQGLGLNDVLYSALGAFLLPLTAFILLRYAATRKAWEWKLDY